MQSQFPNHDREKKATPTVTTQPSSMQLTSQPAREALSSLLAASRERGLSTTLLEDVLGEAGLRSLNLANPAGALRSVRSYSRGHSTRDTGAAELVELFVLREPATRARWQELIGTDLTRRAIDARLIASLPGSADELQLRVDIRPYSFPHLLVVRMAMHPALAANSCSRRIRMLACGRRNPPRMITYRAWVTLPGRCFEPSRRRTIRGCRPRGGSSTWVAVVGR